MANRLTSGKQRGLARISDARGIIAALALDQRTALRKLFGEAEGISPESISAGKLVEFKECVTRVLTQHASAVLLDPEYGLPAARQRADQAGLLLAYEQSGYDKVVPGRLPRLLEHWNVKRLIEAGANCIKLLLYYSPRATSDTNDHKHAFVQRVGAECRANDIPFCLELVSYQDGVNEKSREFAELKPELVTRGIREFSKPQYAVDVLKIGVPVSTSYVQGTPGGKTDWVHTRKDAIRFFQEAAGAAQIPFIYLSEGTSNEAFEYVLRLAAEAGVNFSGVLCGRATWKDGVPIYVKEGSRGLEAWLQAEGAKNIQRINACLQPAQPCFSGVEGRASILSSR